MVKFQTPKNRNSIELKIESEWIIRIQPAYMTINIFERELLLFIKKKVLWNIKSFNLLTICKR